ncbi:Isoleucine--tRNA ligase, chloroplastic/mitochondrial [Vitis vinifera]|uniref:Isoleucine--tRNA ligase, chloroplastic/mitochondrial n=1 Tax=Vitis vinifera TaxID=29760 RepID=A0A438F6T0_VITVI|nr:Isoleucine--tRNA ligase, chloroplastic/mitochondrial [Vitis vinifera]
MTSSRSDWCISRQRTWGVPIPVFYHVQSKEPLMNKETIDHVKSIVSQKGSDAWWYMTVEELLPDKYRNKASDYEKGTDTMDVWFDSEYLPNEDQDVKLLKGQVKTYFLLMRIQEEAEIKFGVDSKYALKEGVKLKMERCSSWAAVLESRNELSCPADLYLEGTDQHRGWFQSSLLTSVATKGRAPYSSVITHGFVLDEKGFKMSKSLGNVVDPRTVIEGGKNLKEAPGYGADVLRLWVSSVDYTGDAMIGAQVLRQMSDIYRKLRGTLRYLLANLHDWKADNAVPYCDLPMIDRHALFQLENVVKNIRESYESYQFFKIFQIIQRFAIVDLSNFYFDVAKDRLYVGISIRFAFLPWGNELLAYLAGIGKLSSILECVKFLSRVQEKLSLDWGTTSFTRRSCQTVLAAHLLSIVRVIAPILPHLAEDVWQNLPFQYTNEDGSIAEFVFESRWPALNEKWLTFPTEEIDFWGKILELRTETNKVLEVARGGKLIGSSLDAKVYLHASDASLAPRLREMCSTNNDADTLHRIFITSQLMKVSFTNMPLAVMMNLIAQSHVSVSV